jgi:hypothetical protein
MAERNGAGREGAGIYWVLLCTSLQTHTHTHTHTNTHSISMPSIKNILRGSVYFTHKAIVNCPGLHGF